MKIFSSLTNQLETITDKNISIYVCGVTPYTECHLGHAMSAMIYDSLIRFLRWRGNRVIYVSNYTDIDDKIIDAAKAANVDPIQLAKNNIEEWEKQQEVLGLEKPNIRPKVTEEIETIIIAIKKIIENGYGYVTEDGAVYYSVRKNKKYDLKFTSRPFFLYKGSVIYHGRDGGHNRKVAKFERKVVSKKRAL